MKNKRGFTLVELLAVIAILALLMAIAIPSILGISNKMKQKGLDSTIESIESATVVYAQNNSNKLKNKFPSPCNKTQGNWCKCANGNDDCKYLITMTVKELINLGAYKPDENDKSSSCQVQDPTDRAKCLDCATILIELDDDHKSATAKLDKTKISTSTTC